MYSFWLNFPLAFFCQCCIIDIKKRPVQDRALSTGIDQPHVGLYHRISSSRQAWNLGGYITCQDQDRNDCDNFNRDFNDDLLHSFTPSLGLGLAACLFGAADIIAQFVIVAKNFLYADKISPCNFLRLLV